MNIITQLTSQVIKQLEQTSIEDFNYASFRVAAE
jgi:hypothetical protein